MPSAITHARRFDYPGLDHHHSNTEPNSGSTPGSPPKSMPPAAHNCPHGVPIQYHIITMGIDTPQSAQDHSVASQSSLQHYLTEQRVKYSAPPAKPQCANVRAITRCTCQYSAIGYRCDSICRKDYAFSYCAPTLLRQLPRS